jgi:spoIIIJ-associated protein
VSGDENSGRLAADDGTEADGALAPPDGPFVTTGSGEAEALDEVSVPTDDGHGTEADALGLADDGGERLAAGGGERLAGGGGERLDAEAGEPEEPEEPDEQPPSLADLEQESEVAADYIEGLLDVADLDGDIDMDVDGDRPLVSVVGATLSELVGPHGEVLEALQELTRLAVHRQTGVRSRIMLDVGGYRARRREELTELGQSTAQEVRRTGVAQRLQAMTPFERKIVHDAVAAAGLRSESEGEEPDRRVVVFPAG